MTSMITASPGLRDALPGAVGPAVGTLPHSASGSTPRRRSRFPGTGSPGPDPTGSGGPRVRWAGSDPALAALVRDHAAAAGLDLVAGPADPACVGTVIDAAALADGALGPVARPARGCRPPLLVVTASPDVPAAVWREALEVGARAVLTLPAGSEELLSRLAELSRPRAGSLLVGVVGACGGAGASSFAARLAGAARKHGPVTLIDADPLGGGTDLLVEAPPLDGIRWRDTTGLGPDDGEALRAGLPLVDEVHLLVAGEHPGPEEDALPPVLSALAALGGTVVVDLAVELVPAVAEHLHQLLVVVPATDHAVRSAARRLRAWQLPGGLARAVVRRRGPLGPRDVCEDLALPLAASFRDSPHGAVPLLDVRRRGADRTARELMAQLCEGTGR